MPQPKILKFFNNGNRLITFNLSILIVAVAYIGSKLVSHIPNDIYWSLRAGKEQLLSKTFMESDSWTFTANGNYWPNHEWLWEALTFLFFKGSFNTLLILNIVTLGLFVSIILISVKGVHSKIIFKRIISNPVVIFSSVVTAFFLENLFLQRALAPALLFFTLFIVFSRKRKVLALLIVMLLWANIHASFFLGLLIVSFTIFVTALINIFNKENIFKNNMKLIVSFPLLIAVTFLQPLGYKLWLYAFDSINKVSVGISEWQPIFYRRNTLVIFYGLIIIVFVTMMAFLIKEKLMKFVFYESLLVLPFLFLPLMAVRNTTYLLIVFLMFFTRSVFVITVYLKRKKVKILNLKNKLIKLFKPNQRLALKIVSITMLSILLVLNFGVNMKISNLYLNAPVVDAELKNLFANKCEGRVMNSYNIGAELEWKWPENKTFIDSRFDPFDEDLVKTISNDYNVKKDALKEVGAKYDIKCVYIENTRVTREWIANNALYKSGNMFLAPFDSYMKFLENN